MVRPHHTVSLANSNSTPGQEPRRSIPCGRAASESAASSPEPDWITFQGFFGKFRNLELDAASNGAKFYLRGGFSPTLPEWFVGQADSLRDQNFRSLYDTNTTKASQP